MKKSMYRILTLIGIWLVVGPVHGIEVETVWNRGSARELKKLQSTIVRTNIHKARLVWKSNSVEFMERVLLSNEIDEIAHIMRTLKLEKDKRGIYDKEPVVGVLFLQCSSSERTEVELGIGRNDRIFASLHTGIKLDTRKKCFSGPGIANLIINFTQRPGGVRREQPVIGRPPL